MQLKWLHIINVNEIEPFQRLLFVLSHENNNWQRNDGLYYCTSEVHERTYSSASQTCKSKNIVKMLTLSVFELYNDCLMNLISLDV